MTAEDPGHGPFLPPGPPADRWEALLAAERAPVQRLIRAFASAALLRRLFRVPARFAEPRGSSLHEREELVQEIGTTKLARRLGRVLGAPKAGDLLDHEIQTSLELLRTVPLEELQRQGWSM